MSSVDGIINELTKQFDREVDLKKSLDSKINSLITIAGSIITINIAIGTFLISKLVWADSNYYLYPIILQVIAIGSSLFSMYFFISKFGMKTYNFPFGHEKFYDGEEYSQTKTDEIKKLPIEDFKNSQIMGYATSIDSFSKVNTERSNGIKWGHRLLIVTLIAIAILVISILMFIAWGLVTIKTT